MSNHARRQRYGFGLGDTLLAEVGGAPLDALHHDVDAICRCYEAIVPLAERLGVEPPRPRLAGFSYCHLSALGAEIVFAEGSEPNVVPLIRQAKEIDDLEEPDDYLSRGVVPARLRTFEKLLARRPDAQKTIGHIYEGPVTSAALLMGGQPFFVLPHDDPERAHRLLSFCVRSAVNYARTIGRYFGRTDEPGSVGIPDDFAGMFGPDQFAEFVVPCLDEMYASQQATERYLHSELLRVEHLRFLADLKITEFDPSADQFLTPPLCRQHCPVPFTARILAMDVRDNTADELRAMYRAYAACEPTRITFHMTSLAEEEKIRAILDVARALAD